MPLDNSILSLMLIGEWRTTPIGEGRMYDFLSDINITIYSDHKFPKAEAAIYTLSNMGDIHNLEITHENKKLKTEIYEIIELEEDKMIWIYFNGKHYDYINLIRVKE